MWGQHYCDRRSQHQRDVTHKKSSNGIYDHVKNNEGHQIDWGKVCFLDNEKNWRGRKIKEAIYINAVVPTNLVDGRKLMNLEKGYDLDKIWSEFNPDIRDRLKTTFKKAAL